MPGCCSSVGQMKQALGVGGQQAQHGGGDMRHKRRRAELVVDDPQWLPGGSEGQHRVQKVPAPDWSGVSYGIEPTGANDQMACGPPSSGFAGEFALTVHAQRPGWIGLVVGRLPSPVGTEDIVAADLNQRRPVCGAGICQKSNCGRVGRPTGG